MVDSEMPTANEATSETVYMFPCTSGQLGFWILDQAEKGNPAGNIPLRLRVTGPLEPRMLRDAFQEIIQRHEALRTSIRDVEGLPSQLVSAAVPFTVEVDNLLDLPMEKRAVEAENLAVREAQRPFDLAEAPLMRARLIAMGEESHILLVTLHHAIADGWSTGVLLRELAEIYDAMAQGRPHRLEPLGLQFGDYAIWESELRKSETYERDLEFWRTQLSGAPALPLVLDAPRPAVDTFDAAIESVVLPKELTGALEAWSQREGHTLFATFLAAFKMVLRNWTGQTDLVISTLVAGRHQQELEPLIGLFVNSLILRTELSGEPTLQQAVSAVNRVIIQALEHQMLPYGDLLNSIRRSHQGRFRGVTPVNFIYQKAFLSPVESGGLEIQPIPSVTGGTVYDINAFFVEREDEGWRASIEFNTSVFRATTIRTLLSEFVVVLEMLRLDPASRLPLLEGGVHSLVEDMPSKNTEFVAPSSPTEVKVAGIWEQVLEVRPIGVHDSFFDLGGHSLQAARVAALTEKAFGRRIRLARLFEAPTVASMAALLDGEAAAAGHSEPAKFEKLGTVVPIRPKGTEPPIFLIHGAGGNTIGFQPFVQRLDARIPVYGVEAVGFTPGSHALETVEEMAERYLADIRAVWPHGPYRLLGYSYGGLVAYELAQRLHAMGIEDTFVGMMDTLHPAFRKQKLDPRVSGQRLSMHVKKLAWGPNRLPYLKSITRSFLRLAQLDSYRLRRKLGLALPSTLDAVEWQNFEAGQRYLPKPYAGRITMFRALADTEHQVGDDCLGWRALAASVDVRVVPGTHIDMLVEPNVTDFARIVREALEPGAEARTAVKEVS